MDKAPEHPRIKRLARERTYHASIAIACFLLAAALIGTPWALWATSVLGAEAAAPLGALMTFGGLAAAVAGVVNVNEAWFFHSGLCGMRDEAEWNAHQQEMKRMQRILKEEGLA